MIPRTALLLLVLVMTWSRADQPGVVMNSPRLDHPGADYTQDTDNDPPVVSPDGQLQVENYSHTNKDGDDERQFWVFDREHKNGWLLNPKPSEYYGADFCFTPDSQWLVRIQKIGSGESTLYLYHRNGTKFLPEVPLGDLAWKFFWSRPENAQVEKPNFHFNAFLVKGLEDNYASLSKAWPKNRYLVVALSGENDEPHQHTTVADWFCAYDLQKEAFVVLPEFMDRNVKALKPQ